LFFIIIPVLFAVTSLSCEYCLNPKHCKIFMFTHWLVCVCTICL
jgi:hypothetical protein